MRPRGASAGAHGSVPQTHRAARGAARLVRVGRGAAGLAARGDRRAGSDGCGRLAALTLTLHPRYLGPPVPADFLGLSFESAEVPRLALFRPGGELDTMLRSLGGGVMRLGGVSADKTAAWVPEGAQAPSWASTTISPADVTRVAELAREAGWSTLWTLNLGHYEPARAAREAAAVRTSFGQGLLGLEVGNEPNAYAKEGLRAELLGALLLARPVPVLPQRDRAQRAGGAGCRSGRRQRGPAAQLGERRGELASATPHGPLLPAHQLRVPAAVDRPDAGRRRCAKKRRPCSRASSRSRAPMRRRCASTRPTTSPATARPA